MKKGKSSMTIMPLGDRVLIKPVSGEEREKKLASGIIIPETVSKEKTDRGEVIAVGEGKLSEETGKRIPLSVKVGQQVLFQWGEKVEINDEEYFLVNESNILAVIK